MTAQKIWTKAEDDAVLEQARPDRELARMFGCCRPTIVYRRRVLSAQAVREHRALPVRSAKGKPWTTRDNAILLESTLSNKELAAKLGRSRRSVEEQRHKLHLRREEISTQTNIVTAWEHFPGGKVRYVMDRDVWEARQEAQDARDASVGTLTAPDPITLTGGALEPRGEVSHG